MAAAYLDAVHMVSRGRAVQQRTAPLQLVHGIGRAAIDQPLRQCASGACRKGQQQVWMAAQEAGTGERIAGGSACSGLQFRPA